MPTICFFLHFILTYGSGVDVGLKGFTGESGVENIFAHIVVAIIDKLFADVRNLRAPESGTVVKLALENTRLASEQLYQLTDRHPRGETVRVHDHIRTYTGVVEGHVLLFHDQTFARQGDLQHVSSSGNTSHDLFSTFRTKNFKCYKKLSEASSNIF